MSKQKTHNKPFVITFINSFFLCAPEACEGEVQKLRRIKEYKNSLILSIKSPHNNSVVIIFILTMVVLGILNYQKTVI